jgi:hypothetical protein
LYAVTPHYNYYYYFFFSVEEISVEPMPVLVQEEKQIPESKLFLKLQQFFVVVVTATGIFCFFFFFC